MKPMNIGIIGCGSISGIYLQNLSGMFAHHVNVLAVSDLVPERAQRAKDTLGGAPEILTLEQIAAHPDIQLVLNITEPYNHHHVSTTLLKGGKHVYSEKPLGISRAEGDDILALAKKNGLRVGGAPDTFLGGGIQTCRKLIDEGWIGDILSAEAYMVCHGHETWHPNPEFYYKRGGGPMFDMGPYYLSALINLLGSIEAVSGITTKGFNQRRVTSKESYGQIIDVDVPTHIAGLMRFASGAVGSLIMSFDIWNSQLPRIEVHGTKGSLYVPDPNTFGGPVLYSRPGDSYGKEVPLCYGYQDNSRGLGLCDMACALAENRAARASSDLTYHVLDAMQAFHESSDQRKEIRLGSSCARPAPLAMGLSDGEIR